MQNQIDNASGNSFIDENHKELLVHLNEITLLLRDNRDCDIFNSGARNFITNIENHFSHEVIILKGAEFAELDVHTIKHRDLSMFLRFKSLAFHNYDDAVQFMTIARS